MEERKNRFILFDDNDIEKNQEEVNQINNVDINIPSFDPRVNVNSVNDTEIALPINEDDNSFVPNMVEEVKEDKPIESNNDIVMPSMINVNPVNDTNQFIQNISVEEPIANNVPSQQDNIQTIVNSKQEATSAIESQPTIVNEPVVDQSISAEANEDTEILEEEDLDSESVDYFQVSNNLQGMINKILKIDSLNPVEVDLNRSKTAQEIAIEKENQEKQEEEKKKQEFKQEIIDMLNTNQIDAVFKSDFVDKLKEQEQLTNKVSMIARYGEDYTAKDFVTNPSIGRDEEIKQLILTLLTPEKSAILVGKPGIGKTSIVEGLAYRLQRDLVPDALKRFSIVNIKTPSLLGTMPNGESRLQTLVDELKELDKVMLFIDEIHMLIGSTNESAMDFANMFKEGLGRGQIKVIGATTTEEYERYILRDKAFVRRFQRIEVLEPTRELTIKILMGTLPKIEKETGAKLKYSSFMQSEIMGFIVDLTSEYKRIYGIGSRYPDICLTLLKEAFSQCIFENRKEVTIFDIRNAISNSKNVYPDVIRKELVIFDVKFKKIIDEEHGIGV